MWFVWVGVNTVLNLWANLCPPQLQEELRKFGLNQLLQPAVLCIMSWGRHVDKQLAVCRDTNMNWSLTWSSDKIRCLLDFWADDCRAQQLEKTHKNQVFKLFSQRLKEGGFDRGDFSPMNGMTAPTWLLLMHFGSLEILPVWNQAEPLATKPLIRNTRNDPQVWKHNYSL